MQNSQLVPPYNPNWLEDFIRRTVRDELAKKEVAQNKPQLSEMEEMALRYNIPLADLESLVRTAKDEVAQEERNRIEERLFNLPTVMAKIYPDATDVVVSRDAVQNIIIGVFSDLEIDVTREHHAK